MDPLLRHSDFYAPKYLVCGFHVRKLATIIAIISIVLTLVSVPYKFYLEAVASGFDILHPKESIFVTIFGYIFSLAPPVCVVFADKKEKSTLYLPQIALSMIQVITCSILLVGWAILVVSGTAVHHGLYQYFAQLVDVERRKSHHPSTVVIIVAAVILLLAIVLPAFVCRITIRARRYMIDEVESGNTRQRFESADVSTQNSDIVVPYHDNAYQILP